MTDDRVREIAGKIADIVNSASRQARSVGAEFILDADKLAASLHREIASLVAPQSDEIEALRARVKELEAETRLAWRPITERPNPGSKIIALYSDGSGATMFYVYDGGFIDTDGDDYAAAPDWLEHNYDLWAYLPDKEFWCEARAEDPMTLPVSDTGRAALEDEK